MVVVKDYREVGRIYCFSSWRIDWGQMDAYTRVLLEARKMPETPPDAAQLRPNVILALTTGLVAIVSVVIGAMLNSWLTLRAERQDMLRASFLESISYIEPAEDMLAIVMADAYRTLVVQSPEYISRSAQIIGGMPKDCRFMRAELPPADPDGCLEAHVEMLQLLRDQMGSGRADADDIESLIRPLWELDLEDRYGN